MLAAIANPDGWVISERILVLNMQACQPASAGIGFVHGFHQLDTVTLMRADDRLGFALVIATCDARDTS